MNIAKCLVRNGIINGARYRNNVVDSCKFNRPNSTQAALTEKDVEEIKIPVPWGHIAAKWWGNKDEVPLIGLHGWQDNACTFDRLVPLLNVSSFLAIDLPGHGLSSHQPPGKLYVQSDYIYTLRRLFDYFKWKKYSILGHSFGSVLGFTYAAIYPDEVESFISIECARTLLLAYTADLPKSLAHAIDKVLEYENVQAPVYSYTDMVRSLIAGSLGSLATPDAAMVLLKRGATKSEGDVGVKTRDDGKLRNEVFLQHEMATSSGSGGMMKDLEAMNAKLKKLDEEIKKMDLKDTEGFVYSFTKDPRVKMNQFGVLGLELIMEFSKHITCPVLSIQGDRGFLQFSSKKVHEQSNDIIKGSSRYFESHDVRGNHHCHLNTPESVSKCVNDFLAKWKYWGPKDRKSYLLIHGWQDNAGSFDNLIPHLPSDCSYLAIDMPGHGLSSHIPKGVFYSPYDSVSCIRRIQKHFGWSKLSVISHSLGSVNTFLFAAIFPDDIDTYIGIDSMKPMATKLSDIHSNTRKHISTLLQLDSLDPKSAKLYNEQELLSTMKKALETENEDVCRTLMKRGMTNTGSGYKVNRDPRLKIEWIPFAFTNRETKQFAERIKCNVLIIKSENTSYYEPKDSFYETLDVVKKSARYCEYHKIAGSHHMHMDKPKEVSAIITDFMQKVKST